MDLDRTSRKLRISNRSLAGHPGAFTEIQDGHAGGYCALWVGVTDGLQS